MDMFCSFIRHSVRNHTSIAALPVCVLTLTLSATPIAPAAQAQAVDGETAVLAVVNDDTITTADLDRQMLSLHSTMSASGLRDFDYHKLLTKLVNDRLLAQEARALGLDDNPDLLEELDAARDRQMIGLFAQEHFKPNLEIQEGTIEAYFDTYYSRLQVRTVSVRSKDEAGRLCDAIRSGKSMDSIARAESLDLYRYGGGLHKNKYYRDVERVLRDPADHLKQGELSDPIPFRDAFAIMRVESRTPADRAELEDHRAKIESDLKFEAKNLQWEHFVSDLAAEFSVTTDTAALAAIRADADSLFTPKFMRGTEKVVLSAPGGLQVTDDYLRRLISRRAMSAAQSPFDSLMAQSLKYATDALVLKAAALAAGYQERPEVTRAYQNSLDSALIEAYIQETVIPQIKFNHAELNQYYADHIDSFKTSATCQFQQMTVPDEETAKAVYARLQEGADFVYLAKQYNAELSSPEESAEWIELEAFPTSIRDEISELRIGQVTSPNAITEGWLLLKLKGFRPGEPKPMSDVETTIKARVFQQKFEKILDKTLSILKEHATIEYDEETINAYFGTDS